MKAKIFILTDNPRFPAGKVSFSCALCPNGLDRSLEINPLLRDIIVRQLGLKDAEIEKFSLNRRSQKILILNPERNGSVMSKVWSFTDKVKYGLNPHYTSPDLQIRIPVIGADNNF